MKVTQGQFNQKLAEILSGMTGAQLLSIPGIYEILAEEFNNDVLDAMNEEDEEEENEEEEDETEE